MITLLIEDVNPYGQVITLLIEAAEAVSDDWENWGANLVWNIVTKVYSIEAW